MNSIQEMFKVWRFLLAATTFVIIVAGDCYAQERKANADSVPASNEIDIFDVVRKWMKKPAKPIDTLSTSKKTFQFYR